MFGLLLMLITGVLLFLLLSGQLQPAIQAFGA